MTAWVLTAVGAALAVGLELLEALAIVLAVGVTRRWRDALLGALGAVVALACVAGPVGPVVLIVAALAGGAQGAAPALAGAGMAVAAVAAIGVVVHRPLANLPESHLKYVVGVMLSAFGVFFLAEGLGVAWPGADAALLYVA